MGLEQTVCNHPDALAACGLVLPDEAPARPASLLFQPEEDAMLPTTMFKASHLLPSADDSSIDFHSPEQEVQLDAAMPSDDCRNCLVTQEAQGAAHCFLT